MRPWLERLEALGGPSHANLSQLAAQAGVRTESGRSVRFVPPGPDARSYELRVFESGRIETRPGSRHDLFNALAWLAFPRTKARINAMHAAQIPLEGGRRGRLRDLLTLFDEGGAVVQCADPALVDLVRGFRWKELFWAERERVRRALRIVVLGHAVLEKALEPWPGIACKAVFTAERDYDDAATQWLATLSSDATPQALAPLPIFGYPGWDPANGRAEYYDDTRYFRPFRRETPAARAVECPSGVGQAAAVEAQRKVRAPQSGMQDNVLARRRDEEGHRDESLVKAKG